MHIKYTRFALCLPRSFYSKKDIVGLANSISMATHSVSLLFMACRKTFH